ncbi:solute carrier family 49 member 4-like [Aphis gossypii]|uniref:solute carrier family 49 member 4-like n=1 Tax=Aphis gossypii TaxID=80765 RepID=UPI002159A0CE|nr:solute carrier family 49 member 4-like [Aphis gossypii]XP_050060107.1 solute carrier family 49 member 4-like [Aphis gossypii]XP_050060109.1 solute carrier family 49 member 4-like [Aphis gossypii]
MVQALYWMSDFDQQFMIPIDEEDTEDDDFYENRTMSKYRFRVRFMMIITIIVQVLSQSIWGPIIEESTYAFPNWTSKSLNYLFVWNCITPTILTIEACRLMNKYGLGLSWSVSCVLYMLGTGIRCMPAVASNTLCLHLSAFLFSLGSLIMMPLIITMSLFWFPENERRFTIGLVYGFKMASSALAYFIYPNVVSMPTDIPENAPLIRHRIMIILYACCIVNIMTILLCLVYHLIPKNDGNSSTLINESKSSTELYENVNYFSSIKAICENRNALYLVLAYALSNTMSGHWVQSIPSMFHKIGHQPISANHCYIFITVIAFILNSVFCSYFKDHKKNIMLGCFSISTLSFFWLMMVVGLTTWLSLTVLKYSCCVIVVAISFNWSCQSMFFNMSSEFEYPLAQPLFAGFMTVISNLFQNIVYLVLYFFPSFDEYGLHISACGCATLSLFFLCLVSNIDTKKNNRCQNSNIVNRYTVSYD